MNIQMVVPCFNEEHRYDETYWAELFKIPKVDWLFVNDGSLDGTRELLDDLKNSYSNVSCINLLHNVGKGEAIRKGYLDILNISGEKTVLLGQIDFDSSYEAEDILRIIEIGKNRISKNSFDSIWAARVQLAGRRLQRKKYRNYLSKLIIFILRSFIKNLPYDPQTSFKLYNLRVEQKTIFTDSFKTRWFFDIELYLRLKEINKELKIWEEPIEYVRDVDNSKINNREAYRIIRDLIKIIYILIHIKLNKNKLINY